MAVNGREIFVMGFSRNLFTVLEKGTIDLDISSKSMRLLMGKDIKIKKEFGN